MTQAERLLFLINYLLNEDDRLKSVDIPEDYAERKRLLRSLMNIRSPKPVSEDFLEVQDAYLQNECATKGIVELSDIPMIQPGIYLWQGDITRLAADAIVNAANSALLGCFVPCHGCIDNAIHSAAGVGLRLECFDIMEKQKMGKDCSMKKSHSTTKVRSIGKIHSAEEPTGGAKITKAYNLPCRYVLHTVGPIIYGEVTQEDCGLLASCYRSCLELATANNLKSIAFCCISTGEFHFPNDRAAEIAVRTVKEYKEKNKNGLEVVFNVFKDKDYQIYRQLLG